MLGKLNCYVAKVCIFLIIAALIAGMVGCIELPSKDLEIWDWHDLDAVRNNLRGHHILMKDLDSTTAGYEELASPTANGGKGWQPIGAFITNYGYRGFDGILDGQGYEIRDLFINRFDQDAVGLFRHMQLEGVIKNIGMVNVTVIGRMRVGGLVGLKGDGDVSNSYATGSVSGSIDVGGLVGLNGAGNVSNSYSTGNVTGDAHVGGLVGLNWGNVSNSYSTGSVTGDAHAGGLVGSNNGAIISDSFWDTETSGQTISDGGTGKNTTEMQDITTFTDTGTEGLDEPWDITTVANTGVRNPAYIWNIVNYETYPFLSWQPV